MNQTTRNVILFLVVCSVFVSMTISETCYYTGTCYQQERYTESCGWWWGAGTCSRYRTVSTICTKSATCTYSLSSCGSCSATCGGGTQSCTYQCRSTYCSLADRVQSQSCNTNNCPVNGGWGPWASWTSTSVCSVTCGGGTQTQTRTRSCNNPVPQYGGTQCSGSSNEVQSVACTSQACPAVHGNWSTWSSWILNGTCSVTCGGGIQTQTRNRSCDNPTPQNGGRQCNGTSTQSQTIQCNSQLCIIDGGWSAWTGWTSNGTCSVTCGGGIQTQSRNRSCNSPTPQNGGRQCNGTSTQSQTIQCNSQLCIIDGGWSAWTGWTSNGTCSVTCGGGIQTQSRNRSCNNPTPQNGGRQCNGTSTQSQTIQCNSQLCIIDGGWSAWTGWTSNGTCSVICGGGIQTQSRNRSCNNPTPQNGGRQCNGTSTQSQTIQCNSQLCIIDGGWSAWTGWTSNGTCSVICGGGIQTQSRNRSCNNPTPQNGGRQCNGTSTQSQTIQCNSQLCIIDGGWSAWTGWTSNGTCSVTCGGGIQTQSRNRSCDNPTPQNGGRQCNGTSTQSQTIQCNSQLCIIDGGWSAWTGWTSNGTCSVTCGGGIQTQSRNRSCDNPTPQNGGRQCNGTSTQSQTIQCNSQLCIIDGGWSAWTGWTSNGTCSVTCGGGIQTQSRNRSCDNPTPQNGGRQCNGTSTQSQTIQCNSQLCIIDGGWSAWTGWTSNGTCSVTCGGGIQTQSRNRSCDNPTPQNGGRQCNGTSTQSQTIQCNSQLCIIDGGWSAWTGWTSNGTCSVTCGGGIQTQSRNRSCDNPTPQNGGRQCNGTSTQSQTIQCNSQLCIIDGGWSAWTGWTSNGTCSVTCGGGIQTQSRNRSCDNPTPQNGGRQCNGTSTQSQTIQCNSQLCIIDGGWSAWTGWTSNGTCSVTCGGGIQTQSRNRSCDNPTPQNGGRQCNGTSTQSQTIQCNSQLCIIDGGWSAWTGWTSNGTCSVTCGGGIQTQSRNRSCDNPTPQNGGRQCNGTSTQSQTIQCNSQLCIIDGGWSAWTGWTSNGTCSVTCGGGIQTQSRNRSCDNPTPQNGGRQCNGTSTQSQTIQCNSQLCIIDGGWSAWTGWTSNGTCSVTCGGGIQTQSRNRSCDNPTPQNGGRQCNGTSTQSQTIQCNSQLCIIDGGWSAWTGWTSNGTCSVTCGGGIQTQSRNRSCDNPTPQNGGRQCNGTSTQSQTIQCNSQLCIIDGGWSAWTGWTSNGTCSVTCGGGIQTQSRNRSCDNPTPQNGGRQCNGTSTQSQTIQCNSQLCIIECNNGDKMENFEDCGKYLICASDNWQEMACSSGTVFNPVSQSCDRPENVPKCSGVSTATTRTTTDPGNYGIGCYSLNCACDQTFQGFIKHPTDCTKFIQCVWNIPFVFPCANGTYWDQSTLTCGHGTC